jgi:two-component system sensor histidine kinase YesM
MHFQNLASWMRILIASLIGLWLIATLVITIRLYAPLRKTISILEHHGIWGSICNEGQARTEMEHLKDLLVSAEQDRKEMKTEMERRMKLLRNAQVGALQAQIRPHFLSNTMDVIRWEVMKLTGEDNEVARVIQRLSLLLNRSLNMKDMLISIEDEVAYSKAYVEIMTFRHANLQDVIWEIQEEVLSMTVVQLTFQPIIENSIYHGIMPKKSPGTITIKGELKDGNVHVYFIDNGKGVSDEEAERINKELDDTNTLDKDDHIGMHNVNQRLKLMFGAKSGAHISKGANGGAVVELVFPAIISEEFEDI